jgi:hypothetical protein
MKRKSVSAPSRNVITLTPIQWVVCAVACLAFAFDLYEILMLPLIVQPAVTPLENVRPGALESILGWGYCS